MITSAGGTTSKDANVVTFSFPLSDSLVLLAEGKEEGLSKTAHTRLKSVVSRTRQTRSMMLLVCHGSSVFWGFRVQRYKKLRVIQERLLIRYS